MAQHRRQSSLITLNCLPAAPRSPSRRLSSSRFSFYSIGSTLGREKGAKLAIPPSSSSFDEQDDYPVAHNGPKTAHLIAIQRVTYPYLQWSGYGSRFTRYDGFASDNVIYDSAGDCVIHFDDDYQHCFRLESMKLKESGLPYLVWLLYTAKELPADLISPRRGRLPPTDPVSLIELPNMRNSAATRMSTPPQKPANPTCTLVRFPTGKEEFTTAEQNTRKIKFRNVLAIICGAPLVGKRLQDLYEVLQEVTVTLNTYACSADDPQPSKLVQRLLHEYVEKMDYLRVGEDIVYGLNMLAWCEDPGVQYRHGWRQLFARIFTQLEQKHFHSIEYTARLSEQTQRAFRDVWMSFKRFESGAEKYLRNFKFPELVEFLPSRYNGVKHAFEAFRRIVYEHYQNRYLSWPPTQDLHWLSYTLVDEMKGEFIEIYDALVDYRVTWEEVAGREDPVEVEIDWTRLIWDSNIAAEVQAWVPLVKAVRNFDKHYGVLHMPLPCPTFPEASNARPERLSRRFSLKRVSEIKRRRAGEEGKRASGASKPNLGAECLLHRSQQDGSLLGKFLKHERTSTLPSSSIEVMQEARLGRWLLIYGVVQVLSMLDQEPIGNGQTQDKLWSPLNLDPPWITTKQPFIDWKRAARNTHSFQLYYQTQDLKQHKSQQGELERDGSFSGSLSPRATRTINYVDSADMERDWPSTPLSVVQELPLPEEKQDPRPEPTKQSSNHHQSQPSTQTWVTMETDDDEEGEEEGG